MGDRAHLLRSLFPVVIFSAIYLLLIFAVPNQYYQLMITLVAVWAIVGISWNILSGYSGLISFGHASFFGIGAYTVVLAQIYFGVSPWFGILIAGILAALAGLLIGVITFPLRGHYFALAMLAYPLALLYIFEWLGYQEVSVPMMRDNPIAYMQFSDTRYYSALALGFLIIAIVTSRLIETSRFGMSLLAIKQNELAAEAAGIETRKWKLRAIATSSAMAGIVGGFYAVILLIVTPQSVFGMLTSAQALIVTLFGGVGTVWGPVIGASILIPLSETLHAELGHMLPGIQGVVFGLAILLVIFLAPDGIFWKIRDARARRNGLDADKAEGSDAADTSSIDERTAASRKDRLASRIVLEVRNLSKSFGGLKAVQNVSFAVPEGSVVGIIGPNGAGKTTLFNLLNGFQKPDAGEVLFNGESLLGLQPSGVCKKGIGRTFQVARPFRRLSILQNVLVGAYVRTPDDATALENARDALTRVGFGGNVDRLAGSLTSVEQRLMELARALAGKPTVLFLDEILAGLGASEVNRVIATIRKLSDSGITIVIIEHTMQAMLRLADYFIVLDHGALLTQGDPQAVIKEPSVVDAYLGKRWRERA
jgi:branched-chain amino acid transport system permease protein